MIPKAIAIFPCREISTSSILIQISYATYIDPAIRIIRNMIRSIIFMDLNSIKTYIFEFASHERLFR